MRAKSAKTVVTFASTSDALAMEAAARVFNIPGRVIPVPSEISAGCGMAWCVDEAQEDELLLQLKHHEIVYEGIFEVKMY